MIGVGVSLRNLRNSVSATALSAYAVLGLEPPLVLDFDETFYRTEGTATDLVSAATHTRAGNATMVDSDGVLKWAPHNLLSYSEDFTDSDWLKSNATASANAITAPNGTETAEKVVSDVDALRGSVLQGSAVSGVTFAVYAKAGEWDRVSIGTTNSGGLWSVKTFNLTLGTLDGGAQYSDPLAENPTITPVGDGWYLCTVDITIASNRLIIMPFNQSGDPVNPSPSLVGDGTSGIYIWGAHLYRSDLGGMVNNPSTGDSYVPTTDSARYLPRVGNHIWNGSAWVDEGYLHESEARTNLVTYSEDFTDAIWVKDAAVTANDAVSPDGTTNADYLSIGANGYIQHNFTHTIGQQYTISAWVKSYDGTDQLFRLYGQDGIVSGDFTATSEWQRFYHTYTATQTTGGDGITRPSTNVSALLHVYGAQVEAGSTPSSYIPTAGATVTRAADTLTEVSPPWGSSISVNIKGTETFADENSATQKLIYDRRVDANNRITLALDTAGANTGKLTLTMANGGSSATISTTAELTPNINEPFNVAFVCTATELGIALNGTAETRVTHAVGLPDLSAEVAAFAGMGTRSLIREWADDLTDQGIAEASA